RWPGWRGIRTLGLTFSMDYDVFDREVANFVLCFLSGNYTRLPIHSTLGPVAAFLGSGASLEFPHDHPATETERHELTTQVSRAISRTNLVDLVGMLGDRLPLPKQELRPPLRYREAREARLAFTKGNRQRARSIEENYVVQHLVMPRLRRAWWNLPIADRLRLANHIESLSWNRYGSRAKPVLQQMPALYSYIEILAISGLDPARSNKASDVTDIQMMVVPLAYAHAFASNDRWMRHLLTRETHFHEQNGVAFLGSHSDLARYLGELA
ncbi:MAG: hypothetical protein KAY32_16580, partial [Candidatus Eisenbacteria sp.]|nr:hypothetical protein [Candidatus Eisenbacteria bacterium]